MKKQVLVRLVVVSFCILFRIVRLFLIFILLILILLMILPCLTKDFTFTFTYIYIQQHAHGAPQNGGNHGVGFSNKKVQYEVTKTKQRNWGRVDVQKLETIILTKLNSIFIQILYLVSVTKTKAPYLSHVLTGSIQGHTVESSPFNVRFVLVRAPTIFTFFVLTGFYM